MYWYFLVVSLLGLQTTHGFELNDLFRQKPLFYGQFKIHGREGGVAQGSLFVDHRLENPEIKFHTNGSSDGYFYANNKLLQQDSKGKINCLPAQSVPPLEQALKAFAKSTELDPSEVRSEYAAECAGKKIMKVHFVGEVYLVCLGPITTIRGAEFFLEIQPMRKPGSVGTQQVETHINRCPKTIRRTDDVPVTKERDQWWRAKVESKAPTMLRDCVFIHGSGQPEDTQPTSSFIDYWGNLSSFTPQCRTRKFIHLNTRDLGWEEIAHQKRICELALSNQETPTTTIRDTIIFTHSMGTLLTAGAFYNQFCNMSNTSRWYGIGAPVDGSNLITFLTEICANTTLQKSIGTLLGVCDGSSPAGAYKSMIPSNPNLAFARKAIQTNINGMMCGTSSFGLSTSYSFALAFISSYAGLQSPNDGLVWYMPCSEYVHGPFEPSPSDYYEASVNHADCTCRNGNGWWGSDRRPCDFFSRFG